MSQQENSGKPACGPLAHIPVVELGIRIAAPFAARLVAEFGAEVIKIEAPNVRDLLRRRRKLHGGTSLWWYAQSRNKKSVTIDLKQAERQNVHKLVADVDRLIENFRRGVLVRLRELA